MVMVYPDIKGIQTPRVEHLPAPLQGKLGQEAIDLASMAGLDLDPWQQYFMRELCSVRPSMTYFNKYTKRTEPLWQAFEATLIVSRQNGKGSILEARELAGLFLFGERLIIHSAHNFDTSLEGFNRITGLIEDTPELKREVKKIWNTNGKQGVELRSGQRLLFKTRTKGGIRGFSCDFLVMDEAMSLGDNEVAAMMPTMAARPNPQILYTGSAGDQEVSDCTQLGSLRARAESGAEDDGLMFMEWSGDTCSDFCPPACDDHDPPEAVETWAKANPGMGIRITVEYIDRERRSMNHHKFLTERLSVGNYPVSGEGWNIVPKANWESRADEASAIEGKFALAVDVTPDRSFSCIAACGSRIGDGELEHVEITGSLGELDHRPGMQWVVPRIIDIWNRHKPSHVVIDTVGQAGSFVVQLEAAGVKVITPNGREYAQACGEFYSAVVPRKNETATLVHISQDTLNSAVAQAGKRKLMDSWAWDKRTASGDISPLVAATLARWGYKKQVNTPPVADPWFALL